MDYMDSHHLPVVSIPIDSSQKPLLNENIKECAHRLYSTMSPIMETAISISLQQFFESFIWSSDFYKQLLVEAKDREIVIDEWKENADTINSDFAEISLFSHKRTVSFVHSLSFLSKEITVMITQNHYYSYNNTENECFLFIDYSARGFPYSSSFHVLTLWILTEEKDSTRILIGTKVHWFKPIILMNRINQTIYKEAKEICKKWLEKSREYLKMDNSLEKPLLDPSSLSSNNTKVLEQYELIYNSLLQISSKQQRMKLENRLLLLLFVFLLLFLLYHDHSP